MPDRDGLNRREFVKGAALTMAMLAGAEELRAAPPPAPPTAPQIPCGVIGLGARGREILAALGRLGAPVVGICDVYEPMLKRSKDAAPRATQYKDHRELLADKQVQAVFVATPTHQHKQIVLEATAAEKHVYCEAPLAHTIDEARDIARAGQGAKKVFQSGLQARCNMQALHVGRFVHSGALGHLAEARAQWHQKTSWRFAAPTPEREAQVNWRLKRETANGLIGEVGMHQLDIASLYLKAHPLAVSGFGAVTLYNDGRDVPDTVQCVAEYPNNVRVVYDATLTNSFDGAYELFLGSDAAIMLRDQRAWMFKEPDAGQLGWEVFARKDEMVIGNVAAGSGLQLGTGIALVADATKQLALGKQPGQVGTDVTKTSLYQAVDGFLHSCQKGERVFAKEPTQDDARPPLVPGPVEGFEATVVGIKANEAVLLGSKVVFQPEWFTL